MDINDLSARMQRPQRHRLLHGYPMSSMMYPSDQQRLSSVEHDQSRPLIIGVIPHTMCNPQVRGCGYCTFPHQPYKSSHVASTARAIVSEIAASVRSVPSLTSRDVKAIYIGGGTANLGPVEHLRSIMESLASTYNVHNAEITLEGVPSYFTINQNAMLRLLDEVDCRQRRISMGVQTFDRGWISKMGRGHFGDADLIAQTQSQAQAAGYTTSCDLLYNLPGADDQVAKDDVRRAVDMGFDQICIYNLVLGRGIPSAWANDDTMIASMRSNEDACNAWINLRSLLLQNGFVQRTLTNFERAGVANTNRSFAYERLSFDPMSIDGIGYGPGAISTIMGSGCAVKYVNAADLDGAKSYAGMVGSNGHAVANYFDYNEQDLIMLALTRGIATTQVNPKSIYAAINGRIMNRAQSTVNTSETDACFGALADAGLVSMHAESGVCSLTERGMFYADSVVGFLSHQQITRRAPRFYAPHASWSTLTDSGNSHGHM